MIKIGYWNAVSFTKLIKKSWIVVIYIYLFYIKETINKEREAWEREKDKGKSRLEEERSEVEQTRTDIAKQQVVMATRKKINPLECFFRQRRQCSNR